MRVGEVASVVLGAVAKIVSRIIVSNYGGMRVRNQM